MIGNVEGWFFGLVDLKRFEVLVYSLFIQDFGIVFNRFDWSLRLGFGIDVFVGIEWQFFNFDEFYGVCVEDGSKGQWNGVVVGFGIVVYGSIYVILEQMLFFVGVVCVISLGIIDNMGIEQ